uniref:UL50 deoxyuridine nucleotidhydrolase n=1 Tax=Meleagrid herpesvirus 1 TaxID=37108 RepID=Q9E1F5_MEHV1|nr:UL50 deoxyuridine nucleotidhydrolase [Meleagrid alphaherpesvirus 1]
MMDTNGAHLRIETEPEPAPSHTTRVPWRLKYRVDETLYTLDHERWTCYIEDRDRRCLRVINNQVISLCKSDKREKYQICVLDLGLRVAVPQEYAVVLAKLADPDPTSRGIPVIGVANGVIDSGYRGTIKAILFYEKSCVIPKNGLAIRLSLVKLVSPNMDSRILFDLSAITTHLECGPSFSSSIATAARSGASELVPIIPASANGIWNGTGCRTLVCLYDSRASNASHFTSSDKNVAFAVRYNDESVVMGLKDIPKPDTQTFVRFYTSGTFGTVIPFDETFTPKRSEDAGYDIPAPRDILLGPLSSTAIVIQQRYTCLDASTIPCIFGRSSLNMRGVIVYPSKWSANSWLILTLCNTTTYEIKIKSGERIAQLLLVDQDCATLLPSENNTTNAFPTVGKCKRPISLSGEPNWRETTMFDKEAPPSQRQHAGFGSTGY